MIQRGNTKLGKLFWVFSIEIARSCVCRTPTCSSLCYAQSGFYNMPSVTKSLTRNYDLTVSAGFVADMISALRVNSVSLMRIHGSGDFYSKAYIEKWIKIAKARKQTRFLAYTRAWQDARLLPALMDLGKLPNVRLWLSADRDTGVPPMNSSFAGVAYLSTSDQDLPIYRAGMVFRDKRKTVMKRTPAGDQVCPSENGIKYKEKMTCSKCGICWGDKNLQMPITPNHKRVSLPVCG